MKKPKLSPKRILGLFFLVALLYFFFAGEYNLVKLWSLYNKSKALEQQVLDLEKQREQLTMEIEKLESDSTYIEKVAREQYKMGRKGETVYIVKEQAGK